MSPPLRSPRARHPDWTVLPLPKRRSTSSPSLSNPPAPPLDRARRRSHPLPLFSLDTTPPPFRLCSFAFAPEHRDAIATTICAVSSFSDQFSLPCPPSSDSSHQHFPQDVARPPRPSPDDFKHHHASSSTPPMRPRPPRHGQLSSTALFLNSHLCKAPHIPLLLTRASI